MIMKKIPFTIDYIRKYLKKKGFSISQAKKVREKNNISNISRTLLSSLIIILIFFSMPLVINFTKDKIIFSNDYENNSKNKLKIVLENQENKIDKDLDKNFLFF